MAWQRRKLAGPQRLTGDCPGRGAEKCSNSPQAIRCQINTFNTYKLKMCKKVLM
jgi:hypothetical protein